MSMIIIEGCDNTGKTTLHDLILKEFPQLSSGYKQKKPPEAGSKGQFLDRYWDLLSRDPRHTKDVVFDRFYFSELVYGEVLRGYHLFSEAENKLIQKLLLEEHHPLIIYCYRSPDQITECINDREQLEGVKQNISTLVDKYNESFRPLVGKGSFVIYDYGNPLLVEGTWIAVKEYVKGGNPVAGYPIW